MNKDLKILCICQNGNCRSVATKMRLNSRGYKNVIPIGVASTSLEVQFMLGIWADIILIAEKELIDQLPDAVDIRMKVNTEFEIGKDIWADPFNHYLGKVVKDQLEKIGL